MSFMPGRMAGPMRLLVILLIAGLTCPAPLLAQDLTVDSEIEDQTGKSTVIPSFPVAEPIDPDKYICGVGDQFIVHLWGKKEGTFFVSITVEGDLLVPSIGKIDGLVGRTLTEVKRRIRGKIATVYSNISYDVHLANPRSFLVYVSGFARQPGEHVANAVTRLSQLVTQVDGPDIHGSKRFVELWRDGQLYHTIDFFRLTRFGELEQDPYLLDGDMIKFRLRGRVVAINGAIRVPGEYELAEGENLKTLIEIQCAGFSDAVSESDPIEITRRHKSDQYKIYRFSQEGIFIEEVELLDHDRIYVPSVDRYQKVIRVQGAVVGTGSLSVESRQAAGMLEEIEGANPFAADETSGEVLPGAGQGESIKEYFGVYPFVEGETVSRVIQKAGGVTPWADTNNAFIRRPIGDTEKDYDTIPLNLTKILIEKDYSYDVEMRAGDFLIVPSIDDKVFVVGEVQRPGPRTYSPYYTVRYYIGLAGGATTRSDLKRSRVIHADGKEEKLTMDAVVNPGDTIRIEEKVFKFWQDHWEIITGTASLVLSGFLVVYAITNSN